MRGWNANPKVVGLILGLQSISRDAKDNVSHPRRLDPTMELITYSFVLYLQHGRRDVKCKPSIPALVRHAFHLACVDIQIDSN